MGISRLIAIIVVVAAATAYAQPATEATRLFEEGRELAKRAKWAEACEKFQKSLALDRAPGTKLNLGDCLEKQGHFKQGWVLFDEATRDFEALHDAARAKFARERAAASAAKLATIVINLAEPARPGLVVRISDASVPPQAAIRERLDPGTLTVTVTAPGMPAFATSVDADAGQTVVVDVPALADVPVPRRDAPPTARGDRRRARITLAFALGGAGGLALIATSVIGLAADAQYDDAFDGGGCMKTDRGPVCTPDGTSQVDKARTKADVATALGIAGVALAGAAVVLYVTAPEERGAAIVPTATASSVGFSLGGRF